MAVFQEVAINLSRAVEDAFHTDAYDAASVIEAMAGCYCGQGAMGALEPRDILEIADTVDREYLDDAIALLCGVKAAKESRDE